MAKQKDSKESRIEETKQGLGVSKFRCARCGSDKLGYQKYVKCVMPLIEQNDGQLEYLVSILDEDDYLSADNGFACRSCGLLIEHCGRRMETEEDLSDYLGLTELEQQAQELEQMKQTEIESFICAAEMIPGN